jgi:hypothetical protein
MIRRRRWAGVRFLSGLAIGGVAAGLVLATPVYLAGSALHAIAPPASRLALLAAVLVALAIADMRDRTPQASRQVPQRLMRVLPPGVLGLTWGFDLGLLVTTKKVASLIWAAVAATVALAPSSAPLMLAAMALTATAAVAAWSMTRHATRISQRMDRTLVRRIRRGSAIIMLLLAIGTAMAA